MGQKVNPIGLRIGINKSWNSVWYDEKKAYIENIHEDLKIQEFIRKNHDKAGISNIVIERFPDRINVNLHSARPGLLIGKKGADIDALKLSLQKNVNKNVYINIVEIRKPEKDATLIAQQVAAQIKGRLPYRRAVKQGITGAIRSGAKGVKISISGRLNGADMARTEIYKEGRIPLHTLRADIDYGFAEALTTFGLIGIKVWVYSGEILSNKEEDSESKVKVRNKK